eukprot:m.868354 g.868354  ORF g.868354 m.868354 type:complete len:57 (-) comp59737_c0_seq3:104-274(-)
MKDLAFHLLLLLLLKSQRDRPMLTERASRLLAPRSTALPRPGMAIRDPEPSGSELL